MENTPAVQKIKDGQWIGVDLDGTLALYEGWQGADKIGAPIPLMVNRVRQWMNEGQEVRIMTARAGDPDQIPIIEKWLEDAGIGGLAITDRKDHKMKELWDDRAVQVIPNSGVPVTSLIGKIQI